MINHIQKSSLGNQELDDLGCKHFLLSALMPLFLELVPLLPPVLQDHIDGRGLHPRSGSYILELAENLARIDEGVVCLKRTTLTLSLNEE